MIVLYISVVCRCELTKAFIISELVELTNDEECIVRLAAIETVANLLQLLDDGKLHIVKIRQVLTVVYNGRAFIFICRGLH